MQDRGQREVTEASMWGKSGKRVGESGVGQTAGRPGRPGRPGTPGRSGTSSARGLCWAALGLALEAVRPGQDPVPGAEQEGPARQWPAQGEPRARGECSKERFISETKAYFFRQDCLCSYLMTSPWPGAQSGRRGGLAGGRHEPAPRAGPRGRPYLVPDIKAGAFHKRIKIAHQQHRAGQTPGQLAPRRAGGLSEGGHSPQEPPRPSDSMNYLPKAHYNNEPAFLSPRE